MTPNIGNSSTSKIKLWWKKLVASVGTGPKIDRKGLEETKPLVMFHILTVAWVTQVYTFLKIRKCTLNFIV